MLFKQIPSKSIPKTKCSMNFALIFLAFSSVFTCGCQSLTDKNSRMCGITSKDTECIPGNCSTVILSQDDYLFLPDQTLFVRPISLTIDGSSYVTSNGTVAICECLFCKLETFDSQYGSCNLTIDDCSTVRLDARDILHLSDGTVFVRSLNARLNDSAYGFVNGSIVVCECLIKGQEGIVFYNETCDFNDVEAATLSTNCSTMTLGPRNYRFQSNATLHVFAWNVTLNDSFYSVTNGSVNACVPDCGGGDKPLQIVWACLMVFLFELFASCGYCMYPTLATNRAKCKIASFIYIASGLMIFLHIMYLRVGYYDVFVVLYYEFSFLAVVEFGMLSIMSSDLILKFLEKIGATAWSTRDDLPQNPMRMKMFYWCSLIIPFVIAFSFRSQELSLRTYLPKVVSSSDYYYSKKFRESVPMFFLYDVALVFAAANLSIFMVSFFWYWRRVRSPNDWQVFLRMTYMMYLTFFAIVTLFWIVGHSILIENELYKVLWPLFVIANFLLSACISWFVFRDNTLNAIIRFFVIQ